MHIPFSDISYLQILLLYVCDLFVFQDVGSKSEEWLILVNQTTSLLIVVRDDISNNQCSCRGDIKRSYIPWIPENVLIQVHFTLCCVSLFDW